MSWHSEIDTLAQDNESPSVKQLKRQLDNLREHNAKLEALLNDVADKYMMQVDGKFVGDLSTRANMLTGRV